MGEEFYREFEHTGDTGIEVYAPTRVELFARAALAMGRIMVAPDNITSAETRRIHVSAATDEDLMHDLLWDALNLFLCDGFIWCGARAQERPGAIALTLEGEAYDSRRHQLQTELKAVTYHMLRVWSEGGKWKAQIVFDV
jgi:SHS2 domain-containing protein